MNEAHEQDRAHEPEPLKPCTRGRADGELGENDHG
jgi:hypothetical protein